MKSGKQRGESWPSHFRPFVALNRGGIPTPLAFWNLCEDSKLVESADKVSLKGKEGVTNLSEKGVPFDPKVGSFELTFHIDALPYQPGEYKLSLALFPSVGDIQTTLPYDMLTRLVSFFVLKEAPDEESRGLVSREAVWSMVPGQS